MQRRSKGIESYKTMEAQLSIVNNKEQCCDGSAKGCVYVVLENGELYPDLYSSYEEARTAVLHNHAETLEEERQECAEYNGMMASQVDVVENTDASGQTKLYVEKEIYIIIQRYKAITPK